MSDGPWLTSREAAVYVRCLSRTDGSPSLPAWYSWRYRHGIIPRGNGTVDKNDLDRELRRKKGGRGSHANSRKNLRALSPTTGSPLGTEAAPASEATAVPQRAQQESA